MSPIAGYHAHVYFDAASREQARTLCEAAGRTLGVTVGRLHDKPVGPHPRGSCQLAFPAEHFAAVIPWLILNRNGLTIFAHAETGDALATMFAGGRLRVRGSMKHATALMRALARN